MKNRSFLVLLILPVALLLTQLDSCVTIEEQEDRWIERGSYFILPSLEENAILTFHFHPGEYEIYLEYPKAFPFASSFEMKLDEGKYFEVFIKENKRNVIVLHPGNAYVFLHYDKISIRMPGEDNRWYYSTFYPKGIKNLKGWWMYEE